MSLNLISLWCDGDIVSCWLDITKPCHAVPLGNISRAQHSARDRVTTFPAQILVTIIAQCFCIAAHILGTQLMSTLNEALTESHDAL